MDLKKFLKILDIQGINFLFIYRLLSGKSVNIIEPFKKAFPEYFKIPVEEKDEFYDILSDYYEAN
jgi:hypothetical protein